MKTHSMTSGSKLARETKIGQEERLSSNNKNTIRCGKTSGRWTKEEHLKFMQGLKMFGQNWKKVEEHVGTRSGAQIRSHAQQFFNRLEKELQKSNSKSTYGNEDLMDDFSFDMNESEQETTMSANIQIMNTLKGKNSKNVTVDLKKSSIEEDEEAEPLPNLNNTYYSCSETNFNALKFDNFLCENSKTNSKESTPIIASQDNLFVKSNSSYFNTILSQINLDLMKIPKLYDLCGWGFEQRIGQPEMDKDNFSFNQLDNCPGSNQFKYQSFKIYEEVVDASKQMKLKNLRRKCSLDSDSIAKKFQKDNNFDELSINSNSDLTQQQ